MSKNQKKKILLVFGTRPEAVKMCPLALELKRRKAFETRVCVSAQHKEMLYEVLGQFSVKPDYDLAVMKERQTLFDITNTVLERIEPVLSREKPDLVLVHGDTSTAFCTALACFYMQIPVGHVEAGLRTYNLYSPFPEEFNRESIGLLAGLHFAPTETAAEHLYAERKPKDTVFVTGNTGLDALRLTVTEDFSHPLLDWAKGHRLLLLTAHRRENSGEPFYHIFRAVRRAARAFPDVRVIYPMHPNPAVRTIAKKILSGEENVRLTEPLEPYEFQNIMARAYIVLTDSGGIQEEAPSLGKPVLVLRNTTERPEGVAAGALKLVGTDETRIFEETKRLLTDETAYAEMAQAKNPYGDGHASERIADILEQRL